jgi:1-acyl-sn-glycerol-3-phosphate acyltransferase
MSRTIFTTPLVKPILRTISRIGLRLTGWKIVSNTIPDAQKGIIIAVPHTSNWDFFVMMAIALKLDIDLHWIGKHSLFKGILGPIARWLGGISVDRRASKNTVQQVADRFIEAESLFIVIAPEGTRSSVTQWKSGFYHMAHQGGVPLILAHLDGQKKEAGIRSEVFNPTGNYEDDIQVIREFYKPFVGIKKKRHSTIE